MVITAEDKGPFCDMNRHDKNHNRVEANYQGKGTWYPGKITNQNPTNNTFHISYDNGNFEANVPSDRVKKIITSREIEYTSSQQKKDLAPQYTEEEKNAKIQHQNKKLKPVIALAKKALDMLLPMVQNARIKANYQGKGTWYPGKIVRANKTTFDIDYDNGTKEKKVPSSRIFSYGSYISPQKLESWLHSLRQISDTDLKYISNIQTVDISCYNRKYDTIDGQNCRDVRYFAGKRRTRCKPTRTIWKEWESVAVGYTADINNDFDRDIETMTNQINAIINEIETDIFNNCENPNTLLDASGMQACGINDRLNDMKNAIAPSKLASNRVMRKIENNDNFPQYKSANEMDKKLNEMYSWNPMNSTLPFNNNYSSLTATEMEKTIQGNIDWAPKQYNSCDLNTTHIGIDDDGKPICVTDSFNNASQKCNQAIDMSKIYNYGTEELSSMWSKVGNILPGNVKLPVSTVLEISSDSCNKWVDMFNIWEDEEAKALSEPCAPERPIASKNDKVLIDMAEEWKASASAHLQQLRGRLQTIKQYIATYPPKGGTSTDLLQLKKEDITLTPSTLPASISVKYKQSDTKGAGPIQYLDMMIPNGKPGEEGDEGIQGIQGPPGSLGPRGKMGETGIYIRPKE